MPSDHEFLVNRFNAKQCRYLPKRRNRRTFCNFQSKERTHLNLICIFNWRNLSIWILCYFQLRESPPPGPFRFPPLHQPTPWGTRFGIPKGLDSRDKITLFSEVVRLLHFMRVQVLGGHRSAPGKKPNHEGVGAVAKRFHLITYTLGQELHCAQT